MKAAYGQQFALAAILFGLMFGSAYAAPPTAKEDYFISADTVIIGCTAGAAAGLLAGSLPVFAALVAGTGLPDSIRILINLTGLGFGVGAASGGVAILTAWMLDRNKSPLPH